MQDIEINIEVVEPDQTEIDRQYEAAQAIAQQIIGLCSEAESARQPVETRWQKSIRQYLGVYEQGEKPEKGAQVYVKVTRAKVDHIRARLYDTLVPSDERNWDVQPTPQPALERDIERGTGNPEQARMLQEQARAACDAMRDLIDDQLSEADYSAVFRDIIDDWTLYGVGIVKGPVPKVCNHGAWIPDEMGNYTLSDGGHIKPVLARVDPLAFFPDPNATSIKDAEWVAERLVMTKTQLRKWANDPTINKRALKETLQHAATETMPSVYTTTGVNDSALNTKKDKIIVWEWHGSLSAEDVRKIAAAYGDHDMLKMYPEDDPLLSIPVVVFVSNNRVLKLSPGLLDTGDCVYSVVPYVKIENSIWGLSECDLIRDGQTALNSAWRMVLDNAALSTRPQIIIDPTTITPIGGQGYSLVPGGAWRREKDALPSPYPPFEVVKIEGFQQENLNMFLTAKEIIDMESCLPKWTEQEPGSTASNTAFGTSMVITNANIAFKRLLKNFDDDIVKPVIRRFYQWNMQFAEDQSVKGDMEVVARGSTSLMAREMRAQSVMALLAQFAQSPNLAPMTKIDELYREVFRANMLDPDQFLKSQEEMQQDAEAAAQQGPQVDPALQRDQIRAQTQLQLAQMDQDTRLQLAEINRDTAIAKLSAETNISIQEIEAMLANAQAERDHKERSQAAETALKQRQTAIETQTGVDVPDGTRFGP